MNVELVHSLLSFQDHPLDQIRNYRGLISLSLFNPSLLFHFHPFALFQMLGTPVVASIRAFGYLAGSSCEYSAVSLICRQMSLLHLWRTCHRESSAWQTALGCRRSRREGFCPSCQNALMIDSVTYNWACLSAVVSIWWPRWGQTCPQTQMVRCQLH